MITVVNKIGEGGIAVGVTVDSPNEDGEEEGELNEHLLEY